MKMKKILLFAVVAAMLFSLASCNESGSKKGKLDPDISQGDVAAKQQSVIDSFGVSIDNSRIVGYRFMEEYLEYVVVRYENGKKTSEATHRFYTDTSYFKKAMNEHGENNPAIIDDEEKNYIKIASNNADTGSYKSDFEKLDADYSLKTPTGTQ